MELQEFRRCGVEDRLIHLSVDDAQLAATYAAAAVFVFPSRYEGFGLPTLEAMAAGCPVILADSSSHPEVGGDAALYFRPTDADDLAAQLEHLLGDDNRRADLVSKGTEHANLFTWDRTASATLASYRRLLQRQ